MSEDMDDVKRRLEVLSFDVNRLWARNNELERQVPVLLTPNDIRVVCRALGNLSADEPGGNDRDAAIAISARLMRGYQP